MKKHMNSRLLFLAFAVLTGAVIAVIVWLFLKISNVGITVIWKMIPEAVPFEHYTIVMCLIGGFVVGVFHKIFGPWPEKMKDAVARMKENKSYPYRKIPVIIAASFLSLFFGGSVGPEAGLVGLLLALCSWAMDQFGMARNKMESEISSNPDIPRAVVFRDMVSDMLLPADEIIYDKRVKWTRAEQISAGVAAGLSGLLVYILLNLLLGSCIVIPHLEDGKVSGIDKLMLIILIVAGIFAGYLYHFFRKLTSAFFSRLAVRKLQILNAVVGGLILGLIGTALPMTMFSGGNDIQVIQYEYLQYTPVLLIVIGVLKLFLTNVCIESGWRGGHFFPVIFSGISIGYGMSLLLGSNQVLSVSVLTCALLASILQQPIGAIVLGVIFFPFQDLGWMVIASVVSGCIPLPLPLRLNPSDGGFIRKMIQHRKQKRLIVSDGQS